MNDINKIASNLTKLVVDLREVEAEYSKEPNSVKLVAVSKTQPTEKILAAINAGQKIFGENRIQEAYSKWPQLLEQHSDIQLHLIGSLQTNKVETAIKLFDVIETVDRPKLATELARKMEKLGRRPKCLIQVNTGEEIQKGGVLPREIDSFVETCKSDLNLPIIGLMCIPPANEEPSTHFVFLSQIAKRNDLNTVSMGMSSDYKIAIRFGATQVRIGTAIFGSRT